MDPDDITSLFGSCDAKPIVRLPNKSNYPPNPCRLLSLSGELRNQIYEYALVSPEPVTVDHTDNWKQPALLAVNKQIREEASSIYYLTNNFSFVVDDFDSRALVAFSQHGKIWQQRIPQEHVRMSVTRVSNNWQNLLRWLHSYYSGFGWALPYSPVLDECSHAAARLFDMVDAMPEHSEWEDILEVLDVSKKLAEEQAAGRWVWT